MRSRLCMTVLILSCVGLESCRPRDITLTAHKTSQGVYIEFSKSFLGIRRPIRACVRFILVEDANGIRVWQTSALNMNGSVCRPMTGFYMWKSPSGFSESIRRFGAGGRGRYSLMVATEQGDGTIEWDYGDTA